MKKHLTLLLLVITFQVVAQTYPITGINISLPANPDANTSNWGTGTSMFTITSTSKAENGRVAPHVMESKILVTIKKGGTKVCGSYTGNTAPEANFNTLTKVWSGINAVALLGQDCVLTPDDYELCVQFFGYGPVGMAPLSDEKCKPFSIKEKEQQTFQPPQPVAPADGTEFSEADAKKPITFRWIPVIPRPQYPVTYRLTVWQLMQGQTGAQAMKVNQPLITKDVDNITQIVINNLVSGPCLPPYLCSFIWNVQSLNHEGKPIGENNGTSASLVFNFKNDWPADNPEEKVSGEACKDFSVVFKEDRKIWKGDSISNGSGNDFMEKRKIWKGDSISSGLGNDFVEKRKIWKGDSISSSLNNDFMEKRKIYKGDSISNSLGNDFVEKRKIWKGDSISFNCTIINNYKEKEEQNKPKTFRMKANNDLVMSVSESASSELTRTPSKFPPGSSQIKWTNNSGDIPNGKTNLGSICFEHVKTEPITVIYEWLNKDEKVICSGTIDLARLSVGTSGGNTIIIGDGKKFDPQPSDPSARKYYELEKEPSNTITKISNKTLDVQFFNKYASAENIKLAIYDVETQKIKRKSRDVIKLNSVTGLNRISIDIKDYNLEPGRLYLLTISDSHTNYNFNFKVTNDREK